MEPRATDPAAAQDAAPVDVAPDETREPDYEGQGKSLMERCVRDAAQNNARLGRDRADMWNLKLDRGGRDNHWSIWDPSTQRYVARGTDPDQGGIPEYIPRCVTNVFNQTINGVTAILDQSEPAQVFAPKTESDEDRGASEVAADAVPVLREECGYDSEGHRHQLNRLSTLTSASAYCVYFDSDPRYGTDTVELFTCPSCGEVVDPMSFEDAGKCPTEGCENTDSESMQLVTDEMGLPVGMPMAKGRMRGELIPSFEFSLPRSCRRANTKTAPWILLHSRMAAEDVARMWPKAKDAAKDKAKWAGGSLTRAFADQMRQLAGPNGGDSSTGKTDLDGPVVYRLQHDPIDDGEMFFPQGFYGVMIGDELIESGPLPFEDADGNKVKNILIRTWSDGNDTQFGHPPGDDLAPLQVSRNLVESMVQLIIMHDAAPTKYLPESVTLIDPPTGVPGEWVRYRSIDGQKPTETRGQNPPESLFNYMDRIDAKFQELSGLNSVLSGQRPSGDPTLGEVQILEERGMATFRAPLDALIQFEKDLSFLLLLVGRETLWSPRFRRIRGENRQWEIKQFAAADLSGQVDIQVERASAWPKSPLMQQLRVKEAVAMGILMPQGDPELSGALLVDMNLAHLKKSLDEDRRQVARELDKWKAAHTPDDILAAAPDPAIIEIPIHVYLKKQFLKSEEAEDLRTQNPALYQAMVAQVTGLEAALQQQQMQAAAAAAGPQPAAPAAAGSGGELESAIEAGALQPGAPAEPEPHALNDALGAGALMPGMPPEPGPQGPSIDDLLEAQLLTPVMPEGEAPTA